MPKLISVIVPIYNSEKVLERCVNSILNQTYKNIELLLVDDGSKDNSLEICNRFASLDNRVNVIHKPNGGSATARNMGLENAKGEYLSFVDSDDFIELNAYEKMIDALERNEADIAVCGRIDDFANKHVVNFVCEQETLFSNNDAIKHILLWDKMDISPCDKVYKRELWDNVRYPVGHNVEDIKTIPVVMSKAEKVVHIGKEAMYHYVHHDGSISRTYTEGMIKDFNLAVNTIYSFVKENFENVDNELQFYMNHSFLDILIMCEKANFYGDEYHNAKNYLKSNWCNKFAKKHFSKRDKIVYLLIRLRLFKLVRKIFG